MTRPQGGPSCLAEQGGCLCVGGVWGGSLTWQPPRYMYRMQYTLWLWRCFDISTHPSNLQDGTVLCKSCADCGPGMLETEPLLASNAIENIKPLLKELGIANHGAPISTPLTVNISGFIPYTAFNHNCV